MSHLEKHTPARTLQDALQARAAARIPGGVNSNVRLATAEVFFARGEGAWLWDVDGRDYVDYLLGQGPSFLGHAPARVNEAVAQACRQGMVFGAQHPSEVEAAERLCAALGWAERVRFSATGTEAVQAALRLARAATGRRKFVRFEGHYHGWLDNVLCSVDGGRAAPTSPGQVASHLDDCILLPWNDADVLESALAESGGDAAAVIMEPMMLNAGGIEPAPGYLARVRELTERFGVVLVFDEIITGFRLGLGGAAERFGVTPDLATYGKALAGGWPVAALAGRADLMDLFGTGVNHSGTFNGSVMACAAVVATLDQLAADPPHERIGEHGEALMRGLEGVALAHGLPLRTQGLPMAFHVSFGDPRPVRDYRELQTLGLAAYAEFVRYLAGAGVWVARRGIWYVSAAHGPAELDAALERFDAAATAAAEAGWTPRESGGREAA